jgi:hypothetical protein
MFSISIGNDAVLAIPWARHAARKAGHRASLVVEAIR